MSLRAVQSAASVASMSPEGVTDAARELTIIAFDEPQTLDPHVAYDTSSRHVVFNVYESLLGYDEAQGIVVPRLAVSAPKPVLQPDGSVSYTFTLRPNVRTHDGRILRSDDAVYSVRRAIITAPDISALWLEPLLGCRTAEPLPEELRTACERIRSVDEAVVITLPRRFRPFLLVVAHWALVVPRDWAVEHGEWDGDLGSIPEFAGRTTTHLSDRANGTGPFVFEDWNRRTRVVRLRRHERYWAGRAAVCSVRLVCNDDARARERALIDGVADLAVCQTESLPLLSRARGIVISAHADAWHLNPVGFITQRLVPGCEEVGSERFDGRGIRADAFSDRHLRRALALSFDYDRFVSDALGGRAQAQLGPLPSGALSNGSCRSYRFDLDAALKELERAWGGAVVEGGCRLIAYAHETNTARVMAAHILQDGFNRLHRRCRMEVQEVPLARLVELLYARRCPIAWSGWAGDYPDAHAFAAPLLAPEAPLPRVLGIELPGIAQLLERALAAPTTEAANSVYRIIARVAIEEQTHLFVPSRLGYLAFQSRWTGVRCKDGLANVVDFASFQPAA